MLTDTELQALWLTFKVSARAVLFALPFAIACAWLLARRRFPGMDEPLASLDAV